MSAKYWTWEKEEAPEKTAFEKKYHKIIEQAKRGEVDIWEAFDFHKEERRFSCKYPSVIETVIQTINWEEISILIAGMIMIHGVSKQELFELKCHFGMKYHEYFIDFLHYWMTVEYPKTWEAEEVAEKARIKKMVEIGKKRLAQ